MIYLDMDGPLVNWTQGVFDLFGKNPKVKPGQAAAEALGVKKNDLWREVKKGGAKWWAGLRPQPWAMEFYQELARIDEVVLLTSPSHLPAAASGKTMWIKDFFGFNFRDYILTSRKDLLAKPGDVLIDDHDKNVTAFTQAGGIGVIFPRMWNHAAKDSKDAVEVVLDAMSQIYPRYTPPHTEYSDIEVA
jgi:5'(3')-deoxyribonucleotidase